MFRKARRVGPPLNDITGPSDRPRGEPCCRRLRILVARPMEENQNRIDNLRRFHGRVVG